MNKFFICFFSICLTVTAFGQNNVGIGTSTPNPGAVLDLTSPSMGFLVPRTKVALVTAPTIGLVIFDTDTGCFVFYNSTNAWQNLCSPHLPPQSLAFNDSIYFNPNGTVTVVDSNGMAIHTSPNSAWITSGNAGTTAGTNFAGTTDAQDFVLKSNSNEVLRATQAGAVGINTPVPDPTSILDITSSTRGVLFPALTSAQRDAITGPAVGLTIYDTDLNVHQFWNGTCWVNVGQTVCSFVYATSYLTTGHSSDCLLVSNFSSVNDTIVESLISGTASPVILSAVGVPAGVIVSFSNNYILPTAGGINSIMTFTALPSAVSGTYNITVLATSGSTVQTLTYTLVVFGFGLTVTPNDTTVASSNLTSGGYVSQAVVSIGNSSSCGSTGGTAQLSATVNGPLATGIGVSFQTTTMPIPGSTVMTINSNCPPAGVYTITVQAQIGVTSSYATYTLTVTGSTPVHVTTNQTNLDISTLFPPGACAGADTVYIDAGVTVCSANSLLPALTTGNIPPGGSLVIINNGSITGAGGDGGVDPGSLASSSCPTANGGNGGDAIFIATAVTTKIINNGTIGGGGGGGGAGAALSSASLSVCVFSGGAAPGGNGGGGAGCTPGSGGVSAGCSAGSTGGATTGGAGGPTQQGGGCGCSGLFGFGAGNSGAGGPGGNLGAAGTAGGNATTGTGVCPAGTGGQSGYSVNGSGCGCYTTTGNALLGPTH
jgi:hypothetical protein